MLGFFLYFFLSDIWFIEWGCLNKNCLKVYVPSHGQGDFHPITLCLSCHQQADFKAALLFIPHSTHCLLGQSGIGVSTLLITIVDFIMEAMLTCMPYCSPQHTVINYLIYHGCFTWGARRTLTGCLISHNRCANCMINCLILHQGSLHTRCISHTYFWIH